MKRSILIILTVVLLFGGALNLWAHEEFRVIGTITKVEAAKLEVKMADGKTAVITLDNETSITRDKNKVEASALKTGLSVVVDAYGDNYDSLLALDVRIVPPIAKGK